MTDIEEAARAFAEAIRGFYDHASGWIDGPHPTIKNAQTALCRVPAPDAPLHEQLAFVGRIAEAVHPGDRDMQNYVVIRTQSMVGTTMDRGWVHAALLAGTAALKAMP